MTNEIECLELIFKKYPEFFSSEWQKELKFWNWNVPGFYTSISIFSNYITDLLNNENQLKLKEIFNFIEYLMIEGNQNVKNAIATCFLENILNAVTDKIQPEKFVYLLGEKSKEYCRAWDKFSGVKTKGLWENNSQFENFDALTSLNRTSINDSLQELEEGLRKFNAFALKDPRMRDMSVIKLAEILDEYWLLCPNCSDAWECNTQEVLVICPKCDKAFRNPRYKQESDEMEL